MDEERYGNLLKDIRPRIIETAEEHERLLTIAEELMEKGDRLSQEERQTLALIVLLVEAFESNVLEEDDDADDESEGPPAPHVALQRLMQGHELDVEDITPIFGNPHLAREALEGKRPISRTQAKDLSKYFRVPAKLFRAD